MNNCLVTKLKETVNNDNLDIYGVIKLRVASGAGESYFNFGVGDDSEIIMTLESDDENEYFTDFNRNKIGKTITAKKNQSRPDVPNAFRVIAKPGTVVTIKDGYKLGTGFQVGFPCYQYGKSLEQDLKWREYTILKFANSAIVCNVKKLIKATNNAPFDISFERSSENVVYDDIKVLAYCKPVSESSLDFGNLLLKSYAKVTILGKLDILQIIAVRRYLGNTEGEVIFSFPENAYLGDTPLSSFGSFVYIKFAWTEDTVKVYTANNNKVYSEKATISNSDKYDWE